ncbi:MAG: outer membrane protein OmpA/MotB family [Myxococcaceae bacterium]|nr:outer membrane protein OmpA/MotB family [Myxococcaceae bacterium]
MALGRGGEGVGFQGVAKIRWGGSHVDLRVLRHRTHHMLLSIPPRPSTRTRLIPGLSLRAGDTLPGGYRALSLIRADRACAHLAALDTSSNRRVDVEILLAMDDAIEAVHLRFLADARKAAALQSPHVDRVLHVGVTQDGHPFVARETSSGELLAELLAKMGSLPTEHAVDIAIAICGALQSAHAVGVVHAELDPTMVRLDWNDGAPSNVKVSGLGTSRALAMLPTEGRSFMSLALRAPELLRDDVIDARVDVWGVGVLLYTMLAGEMPFAAESPSKMDVSSTGDEPALLAGVPDGLGEIVDACLARDPAVRPQTATSLAARLALFGARPVFEKRASELVVDTGPYQLAELERALREAKGSDRNLAKDAGPPSTAPSRNVDKTPEPVTVTAPSSPPPPVAMTLAPPASAAPAPKLRSTLAPPTPARRWRTLALVAAACGLVGIVDLEFSID